MHARCWCTGVPTCFMLSGIAFARRDSSGSDGYGDDGREEKKERGTTQRLRAPFLFANFRTISYDVLVLPSGSSFRQSCNFDETDSSPR